MIKAESHSLFDRDVILRKKKLKKKITDQSILPNLLWLYMECIQMLRMKIKEMKNFYFGSKKMQPKELNF